MEWRLGKLGTKTKKAALQFKLADINTRTRSRRFH